VGPGEFLGEMAAIENRPHSATARAASDGAAIRIETLPFIVGRTPGPGESEPRQHPDLSISDKEPFRLSRDHFMIARIAGHIVVQDLESTLGTVVNGRPIGRDFASDSAELRGGENRILAGGIGSPFEFHVLAREA
jgi:CRP/FNR family transcriptional regulator, cyclic AMP receptor protein